MGNVRVKELYYITHIDNLPSILKRGIFSHESVDREGLQYTRIYDTSIVVDRQQREVPDGRSLWSFANLYFQPRNPMLYRVLCERSVREIAVIAVRRDVPSRKDIYFSTGNAASFLSDILPWTDARKAMPQIKRAMSMEWWKEEDGSKRVIMAECLVPDSVPPDHLAAIYVASHEVAEELKPSLHLPNLPVIPDPKMFFRPFREVAVTPGLTILEGDMFFSRMQTLTVSVNVVGIMGKGLASRAKDQFPDVYVFYQDLCRKRILKMGKPHLYKRESSFDYQLADEPSSLSNANSKTWFLLFATKRHWRERADIQGIEKGLEWLRDKYEEQGIKSLALPALGCGLGRLQWREVGPLMCKSLSGLDIPVQIYLPAEREVSDELLTKDFLLP